MIENGQGFNPGMDEEEYDREYAIRMAQGFQQEMEETLEEPVPHEYEEVESEGPTMEDLELWKKQFPMAKIFRVSVMGDPYFVRTLNRVEYKAIVARQDLNAITREEVIAKTCCLWPMLDAKALGEGGAGVPASLAQFIMRTSGFDEPEEVQRLV